MAGVFGQKTFPQLTLLLHQFLGLASDVISMWLPQPESSTEIRIPSPKFEEFAKVFNFQQLFNNLMHFLQMPSYSYKYSSHGSPSGDSRRSSVTRTSYSSRTGGPGSGLNDNFSSYTNKSAYSSLSTSSSSNWKTNDNGFVFSASGKEIFEKMNDAEHAIGFKDQDYNRLKENCRRTGRLFEDTTFPADDRSLFFSQPSPRNFVWKRPGVSINLFQIIPKSILTH